MEPTRARRTASALRNASLAAGEPAAVAVRQPRLSGMLCLRLSAAVGLGLFLFGRAGSIAQPAEATSAVEVQLVVRFASKLPVQGFILLSPIAGERESIQLPVDSLETLFLKLPAGSSWIVSARIADFWVRRTDLNVGSSALPTKLTLELWPLGKLSGVAKFKPPELRQAPREILLRTLDPPASTRRSATPPGVLRCPAEENGAWSCSLPAGTYDLAISAEGFAPSYRKKVLIPPGGKVALGEVALEKGGSVAGWVTVEDGKIDPGSVTARLKPLVAGGASLESALELGRNGVESAVGSDGLLLFSGLSPGSYELAVELHGLPPIKVTPVRVAASAETFLPEPLVLRKPRGIEFEVSPRQDWLDRAWRARVFRIDSPPARPLPIVYQGSVGIDGRIALPAETAGRFRVDLIDSQDNRWTTGEHEFDLGETSPRQIEVRWITVVGTVRLGKDPLSATLWFGGRSGASSIKMVSDEKGRFHGVLPKPGLWPVEIDATEPRLITWNRADVRAGQSDRATMSIDLPDTRVFGRVVDEAGQPVTDATLLLEGESIHQLQGADSAGHFSFRGLAEGALWLGAESEARKLVSDKILVTVAKDRATGPLELRLSKLSRISGRVVSSLGPIAGARVLALSKRPSGGGGGGTTEVDGSFVAEFPGPTSRVVLAVSAPGFALQAFDVPANDHQVELRVSEAGGTLTISLPNETEELQRQSLALAVLQNGVILPTSMLYQWAYDHGQSREGRSGTLTFPALAPGEYRVCLVPNQLTGFLHSSGIPEGATCDMGSLAPGGTLQLSFHSAR